MQDTTTPMGKRVPWNKGKLTGAKPPLRPKHVWAIRTMLQNARQPRDLALRRTKATLIYRRTGNLRAVQLLLGHSKIESTVRYLGVEVDDAIAIDVGLEPGAAWFRGP
jgi:integrase